MKIIIYILRDASHIQTDDAQSNKNTLCVLFIAFQVHYVGCQR